MSTKPLFEPLQVGPCTLAHRVVMAPLTRMRATVPGHLANELNAQYYAQRASAGGLIIAEASQVMPGGGAGSTPGIHTPEQIEGWKGIVQAIHAKGGFVFLQLWHMGRISRSFNQPGGAAPIAPSAIAAPGMTMSAKGTPEPFDTPRALRGDEIPGVIEAYAQAAVVAAAQALEGFEYPQLILPGDADAVVADVEDRGALFFNRAASDRGIEAAARVLQRVVKQVDEDLLQPHGINSYGRQVLLHDHLGSQGGYLHLPLLQHLPQQLAGVEVLRLPLRTARLGIGEERLDKGLHALGEVDDLLQALLQDILPALQGHLGVPLDHRQGAAQIVGYGMREGLELRVACAEFLLDLHALRDLVLQPFVGHHDLERAVLYQLLEELAIFAQLFSGSRVQITAIMPRALP